MTFYISIYIIITISSLIMLVANNKEKKKLNALYFTIVFVIFFTFSALRASHIGSDTQNYVNLFKNISFNKKVDYNKHFEIGYQYFNLLLSYISGNQQTILIVTSFFNVGLYMIFYKKTSKMIPITIILYLTTRQYFSSYNLIRQTMASCILFLAYFKLNSNKTISFILITLLASTFHTSALVFLIVLLIRNTNSKLLAKIIVISSIVILLTPSSILFKLPYYGHYLGSKYDNSMKLGTFLSLILYTFTIVLYYLFGRNKGENKVLVNIVILGFLISILGVKTSIADRLSVYFLPFSLVLLSNTLYAVKDRVNKISLVTLVIILYTMNYFIIQIHRPEWNRILPYEFFFI